MTFRPEVEMMPTIEISPKLYQTLQSIAVPFEDKSPEDVIWRLYRERADGAAPPAISEPAHSPSTDGLISAGVLIPNGLELRFNYRSRLLPAEVRDGRIWIGDKAYSSPSAAATAAAAMLGWPERSLNGWWSFEYLRDGKWHRLQELREPGQRRRRK